MKYTINEMNILTSKESSYEILYAKTSLLISKWFKNKVDKASVPYINHLYYVASKVNNDEERLAALLHDILEDTSVTIEELENYGYPKSVLNILKLLTRKENVSYDDYINNIICSNNKSALNIKRIDMEHNMDFSRLEDKTIIQKLKNKYEKNYSKILEALREEN